jgi:hypothetical protein
MSFLSVFLRLLLILSLIFNGSSYAAAKLQIEHSASVAAAHERAKTENASPCPEHADVTAVDQQETVPATATDHHSKPDCCGSAKCAGACLQHTPAAIVATWIAPANVVHDDVDRRLKAAHATPALPLRIRPPIG